MSLSRFFSSQKSWCQLLGILNYSRFISSVDDDVLGIDIYIYIYSLKNHNYIIQMMNK